MITMNPATIQLEALPAVPIQDRKRLPSEPGVYFVISSGTVIYVGRTTNLYARWANHHRIAKVQDLDDARIAWFAVSDTSLLEDLEQACIDHFAPVLNGLNHGGPGRNQGRPPSGDAALIKPITVKATQAEYDAYRAAPAAVQAEARAAMRAAMMAVISKENERA